jgi:hypothetical protein
MTRKNRRLASFSKGAVLFGSLVALASCGTAEYQATRSSCTATWMQKIPPVYEQELYNQTQYREVPTGETTCTSTGGTITCKQIMRTEAYTVVAVRTVDRAESRRVVQIDACTKEACTRQYGNAECKA